MQELEPSLRSLLTNLSGKDLSGVDRDEDLVELLGMDSLAGLRMLAMIEKAYSVRFRDDRLHSYRTLRQILAVIEPEEEEE